MKEAVNKQYNTVEMTATECQQNLREYLTRTGFEIRQVYYQRVLANSDFRVMKSQMGINLENIKLLKDEWQTDLAGTNQTRLLPTKIERFS